MILGEARDNELGVVEKLGATSFPSLYVLDADGGAGKLYEGELKPQALTEFLEANAGPEPEAGAADGEKLAEPIDASNYVDLVESAKDVWLLVFGAAPAVAESLAEAVFGQVKVGTASAEEAFAKKLGVKADTPSIVLLPYGDSKASLKKVTKFETSDAGQADAKKAALEAIPSSAVAILSSQLIDQWMQMQMQQAAESQSICILFSDKATVPPLFRSVSLEFEGQMGFGMVNSADSAMMQRFGIDKAPAILVLFPEASKEPAQDGQMQLGGARFDPRQHGPFKYGYVANFLGQMVAGRLAQLGKTPKEDGGPTPTKASAKKETGPVPELTPATWESECSAKGGLCAIAMIDGAPENSNKQASLDMLTKMRKKRAGGPLAFSWLDATCQTAFAAAFNIYETDLPTMIVLSPGKKKWARSVGAFEADALGAFGTGVATGRVRTDDVSEIPSLEDIDCATFKRGPEVIEEEPLGDDIMAEILEEERREREAREAELAASGVKVDDTPSTPAAKDKSKMSKLELLESEVEECEAMDLLCSARREKQVKAVQKQRDLEDKLKEIAAKKKKKAKKAKKAAAKGS